MVEKVQISTLGEVLAESSEMMDRPGYFYRYRLYKTNGMFGIYKHYSESAEAELRIVIERAAEFDQSVKLLEYEGYPKVDFIYDRQVFEATDNKLPQESKEIRIAFRSSLFEAINDSYRLGSIIRDLEPDKITLELKSTLRCEVDNQAPKRNKHDQVWRISDLKPGVNSILIRLSHPRLREDENLPLPSTPTEYVIEFPIPILVGDFEAIPSELRAKLPDSELLLKKHVPEEFNLNLDEVSYWGVSREAINQEANVTLTDEKWLEFCGELDNVMQYVKENHLDDVLSSVADSASAEDEPEEPSGDNSPIYSEVFLAINNLNTLIYSEYLPSKNWEAIDRLYHEYELSDVGEQSTNLMSNYGIALYIQGKVNEAIAQFEKTLDREDRFAESEASWFLAHIYNEAGDVEKSESYKQRCSYSGGYKSPNFIERGQDILADNSGMVDQGQANPADQSNPIEQGRDILADSLEGSRQYELSDSTRVIYSYTPMNDTMVHFITLHRDEIDQNLTDDQWSEVQNTIINRQQEYLRGYLPYIMTAIE
jgi:tetratricopeptide (TPR) repeat protein